MPNGILSGVVLLPYFTSGSSSHTTQPSVWSSCIDTKTRHVCGEKYHKGTIFQAPENSILQYYEKQNAGTMKEETVPVSHTPCAEGWWGIACPGEVIALLGVTAAGVEPPWTFSCNWAFPRKIELFSYDTRFFFTCLPLRWLPPPPTSRLHGGLVTNNSKNPLPAVPLKEALNRGSIE